MFSFQIDRQRLYHRADLECDPGVVGFDGGRVEDDEEVDHPGNTGDPVPPWVSQAGIVLKPHSNDAQLVPSWWPSWWPAGGQPNVFVEPR